MFKIWERFALAAVVAAILGASLVPRVIAWSTGTTCDYINGVCVYEPASFGVPKAVTNSSDSNYSGDKYPNTNTYIDNSVTSVINAFTPSWKDIMFSSLSSGGGLSYCLNAQESNANLAGLGFSNVISSHAVSSSELCS